MKTEADELRKLLAKAMAERDVVEFKLRLQENYVVHLEGSCSSLRGVNTRLKNKLAKLEARKGKR